MSRQNLDGRAGAKPDARPSAPSVGTSPAQVPGEGDAAPTPTPESPTIDPRVAELEADLAACRKALDDVNERLHVAEREHAREIASLRARFDHSWRQREEELAARPRDVTTLDEAPPSAARRHRAVGKHVLVIDGRRVSVDHDRPFPEGFDVTTLPAGSYITETAPR